jgi:hypothetical protein
MKENRDGFIFRSRRTLDAWLFRTITQSTRGPVVAVDPVVKIKTSPGFELPD